MDLAACIHFKENGRGEIVPPSGDPSDGESIASTPLLGTAAKGHAPTRQGRVNLSAVNAVAVRGPIAIEEEAVVTR